MIDRLPPHDIPSEQAVIGCQLLDPSTCIPAFAEANPEREMVHYDLRHQLIQKSILAMTDNGRPVDLITLMQEMSGAGTLPQIGGITYLNELQDVVTSTQNFQEYHAIVREKFMLRRLIKTCSEVSAKAFNGSDTNSIFDSAERDILSLRQTSLASSTISKLLNEACEFIEQRAGDWSKIFGLPTGLADLDRQTDGLHPGELVVIGAPTSCGKTTLALQICLHNAMNKIPVAFMSAEMLPLKLAMRMMACESRVNMRRVSEPDVVKLTNVMGKISKAPIHLESVNGMTIGQVQAKCRRMVQQHALKIIVIENIQIIQGRGDNREQQVASVAEGMKAISMEHGITVIGLSQLNDEGRLRDSRAIGHHSDSAWLIVNDGEWKPKHQPVILRIEKCRDGETGNVPLLFLKEFTRFEGVSKISDADVPQL